MLIAVPAYQNYTIRAQLTEGTTLANVWMTTVAEYYRDTGIWPSATNLPFCGSTQVNGQVRDGCGLQGTINITYHGAQVNTASGQDATHYQGNEFMLQCSIRNMDCSVGG
jgi:type IV pilus assembly protein PilA